MKYTVVYSPKALKDLDRVWDEVFTASADITVTGRYLDDLLDKVDEKPACPFFGKPLYYQENFTGYYMIKAVYFANKKSGHIVVGIKNITSSIQDENEYKEAVGQAIEMAVIDDLTGVKNRNAYVKHENELTVAAENDENIKFAIVILDVNGLKRVNDTMGHKAGDMLLRDAAKLICDVYKGNSIYRIGGDEFAVILMDDAYDNRDALLEEFRGRVTENMDSGAVTIASGLAVFQVETDIGAENVFERADAAMYLNKREMKNILVQKEEEQKAAKD